MHGCFARPKKTGRNNEVVGRRGSSVFILLSNKSIHGQIRDLLRLVFPSNKVHWCWNRNKLHCKGAEGCVSVRFCLLAEVQTGKYKVPNYFITLPFNQETLNTVGTFYRCRWLFKLKLLLLFIFVFSLPLEWRCVPCFLPMELILLYLTAIPRQLWMLRQQKNFKISFRVRPVFCLISFYCHGQN